MKEISKETIITKEKELLRPTNDIVFQSLFTQKNEEITKSFISDLLGEEIINIKINENKELFRERPEDKLGILDLEAEVNNNEKIDIEVQLTDKHNLVERIMWYFSRIYYKQIGKGDDYRKAKRVVIIAIVNFDIDVTKQISQMETIWNLREKKYKDLILTDKIELHIINLNKAMRDYKNNKDNRKAQWMLFLNNPNDKEVESVMKNNDGVKKAVVEIVKMTEDEKMERLAFLRQKARLDEKSMYNMGVEDGIKEGEKNKQKDIAKKMKNQGIDINIIAKTTELTMEEIKKL